MSAAIAFLLTSRRYLRQLKKHVEKLTALGGIQDPYVEASAESFIEWQDWPNVQHADIYNYLITRTSPYTHQQLKA